MKDQQMPKLRNSAANKPDFGFRAILLLILLVACWLLALPMSRFVQRASLNRFHLQTRSFALWAVQQPIPAMYNFHNRYEIRPSPWAKDSPGQAPFVRGTANHFPLRLFTFGDNRAIFLRSPERRQIDIWSSYRGEELHTRWTATPLSPKGFELTGEVVE